MNTLTQNTMPGNKDLQKNDFQKTFFVYIIIYKTIKMTFSAFFVCLKADLKKRNCRKIHNSLLYVP